VLNSVAVLAINTVTFLMMVVAAYRSGSSAFNYTESKGAGSGTRQPQ
jgi:hypothetical protein